jgi:ketosteroid isomerase-like protein
VWDRELGFAKSVHDHDATAFAEHVLAGAVFVNGDKTLTRGREEVAKRWAPVIRGDGANFEWHPTQVAVTSDPRVALSRGPFLVEYTKPDASPRFVAGTYESTWVMDSDGAWRVAIDGEGAPPKPVTLDEAKAIRASISAACPATEQ